jgi:hypothetical protein
MNVYPDNRYGTSIVIEKPVAEQLARDIATETNARIAADNVLRADIDEIVLSGHNSLTGRDADNCHPQSAITSLVSDLASKAPIANPTFTGTVSGVTKAMVGLSDVDNTSDASKPVSTATQTALNLKANLASPALTGTPTTPTASAGTNTTQIASTAFVRAECAAIVDAVGAGIIESGYVSGRGWYIKFGDGTMIQFGRITPTWTDGGPWGSRHPSYSRTAFSITLPTSFYSTVSMVPVAVISGSVQTNEIQTGLCAVLSVNSIGFSADTDLLAQYANMTHVSFVIFGRWKA